MQTLLVITYVDFWRKSSGHRARINSLLFYFKSKIKITIFFAGAEKDDEKSLLNTIYPEMDFVFAGVEAALTYKEYKEKFRHFIKDKFFDFAMIEYIELSSILEYLPKTTITMLDTHDIVYNRIESFNTFRIEYNGIVLNKEEELNIYKCYDYIILIQKRDFENVAKEIGNANLLLIPHPAVLKKKNVCKTAKNVGYIASAYSPNIDALNWFIKNVWKSIIKQHDLVLNIYGTVCGGFPPSSIINNNIVFHGFVDDLNSIYDSLDIIVNPVRCGAGLKIKNIEALGYGMPLITTTHGASGIEDGASKTFLIADTPEEFLLAFDKVAKAYNYRKQISKHAFEYAQCNFSEEKCYGGFLQIINSKN